ncbi:Sm domain [Theobroma cacao]|nr:Sm domain [Theobroma cacao]
MNHLSVPSVPLIVILSFRLSVYETPPNNHSSYLFKCTSMEQEVGESLIQLGSSDDPNSSSTDPVTRVRKLLFRRMLVGIKDGRFFLGTFHCIDKQGNIILQDSIEYRSTRHSSPSPMEQRCLGLILIPFSCRTSCHVDCSINEQLSLLKAKNEIKECSYGR